MRTLPPPPALPRLLVTPSREYRRQTLSIDVPARAEQVRMHDVTPSWHTPKADKISTIADTVNNSRLLDHITIDSNIWTGCKI